MTEDSLQLTEFKIKMFQNPFNVSCCFINKKENNFRCSLFKYLNQKINVDDRVPRGYAHDAHAGAARSWQ
jgi:hypothetical protein